MLANNEEQGWLSKLYTKYRKVVGTYKNMKNNFYSNNTPSDDLESKFYKKILEIL